MSAFTIAYVLPSEGCPSFTVDFRHFARARTQAQENASNGIRRVVLPVFHFLKCFFEAFKQASCSTLSMLSTSFKYTVLGYYGGYKIRPPDSLILTVFKVAAWVVEVLWCIVSTTGRLLIEKMDAKSKQVRLSQFQSDQINLEHFKTKELALDASGVPPEITVESLAEMLNNINFDNPLLPGYMPPSSRNEAGKIFTKEELSRHLNTFIHNVRNRVPFLGTPPPGTSQDYLNFISRSKIASGCQFKKCMTIYKSLEKRTLKILLLIKAGPCKLTMNSCKLRRAFLWI